MNATKKLATDTIKALFDFNKAESDLSFAFSALEIGN